ncbi:MAG: hypothetical protein II842_14810 [Butyrivibrio sp.]|nr:hypothetical protein [Butyrivibrio sp.]
MAFDVSNIVSAVNSYLYSISDVNKLMTEGETSAKTSGLAGIFQKYLNKAVSDTASTASATDAMTDGDVLSAATSLSSLATSSAFDTTGNSLSDTGLDSLMASSLPDLLNTQSSSKIDYTELSTSIASALRGETTVNKTESGKNAATAGQTAKADGGVAPVTRTADNTMASAINSEIQSRFASVDIESQINQAFKGLDLESRINSAFKNVDASAQINAAFHGTDLGAEIENSINSHNRIGEAVSYNEARLQAYKNSVKNSAGTSTFGDFRL